MQRVHSLLHATETAVRTFQRSFQWREVTKVWPFYVHVVAGRLQESATLLVTCFPANKDVRVQQLGYTEALVTKIYRLIRVKLSPPL